MNTHYPVIIIGAGLSGLHAAYLLQQQQIEVKVLEARSRLGGRIRTVEHGLDLGPTWFWTYHHRVQRLMETLDIAPFQQYEQGEMMLDLGQTAQRVPAPYSQVISYRFAGGAGQLIRGLAQRLTENTVELNTVAQQIRQADDHLQLTVSHLLSGEQSYTADHLIVTLPPRLLLDSLSFEPQLPLSVQAALQQTQTWMGQAMKVVLAYPYPFWRKARLSGLAFSYAGPVQQFHDATPVDEQVGALFGWLSNQGEGRRLSRADRQAAVIRQATRLFGPQAAVPLYYDELNWAYERFTSSADEGHLPNQDHPKYGNRALQAPVFDDRLHWASTEIASEGGGYLEGALHISQQVVERVAAGR